MAAPASQFDRSVLYSQYSAHKKWIGSAPTTDVDRFSRTIRRLNLPQDASILEIGFGQGRFLDWARSRNYHVEGVEILPEMVQLALARGHIVHLGTINQLAGGTQKFDLIAAFDVIEHLDLSEIVELLANCSRLLTKNGKIVFQFPNAASPFSALYQSGDATHQTAVSAPALEQIARTKGFIVTQFFNARSSYHHPLKQIRTWVSHIMRDVVELILSYAYYGMRYPLDPNIAVVLERSKSASIDEVPLKLETPAISSTID